GRRERAAVGAWRWREGGLRTGEAGEERELLDEDLRALSDGLVRWRGAGGPDLEDEAGVVGDLAHPGVLDGEIHALDGREEGVDRDDPDRETLLLVAGAEAAAGLDRELHPEGRLRLEGRDLRFGVHDLDLARRLDVGGRHIARASLLAGQGDRLVRERAHPHVLQVEHD